MLEKGLVEAEADRTPERIEPLMRAAHSIKGAARIVGLTQAVSLAHAMEDLLAAAQKGHLALTGGQVDLLLKGNDLYAAVSKIETAAIPEWIAEREAELDRMAGEIRASLPGAPAPPAASAAAPEAPQPPAAEEKTPAPPAVPEPAPATLMVGEEAPSLPRRRSPGRRPPSGPSAAWSGS